MLVERTEEDGGQTINIALTRQEAVTLMLWLSSLSDRLDSYEHDEALELAKMINKEMD